MSSTPKKNIRGLRFGYLSAYEYLGRNRWDCLCCKCNRHVLKRQSDLESGKATMCDACLLANVRGAKSE